MKKYNIVEKLRIVKDILNVFRNDAKRFATLTNKFKKLDFKYAVGKDDTVTSVTVNDIPNDIFEAFLDSANSNARSEKVKLLLSNILDNKASVSEIKKEKPKATKAAKEKAPAKTTKAAKEKASVDKDSIELKISNWIDETTTPDNLGELQKDILDAFKTDSRLNATMENWMKKSSDLKTQVTNMFTTAYTRKPNNGKMKKSGWYAAFEQWNSIGEPTETKSVKEIIEKDAVKKVEETVKEVAKAAVGPEMETFPVLIYDSLFASIRCSRENVSKINGSMRQKDVEQIAQQFSISLEDLNQRKYLITCEQIPETEDYQRTIFKKLFTEFVSTTSKNQSIDQLLEEESEFFGRGLGNVFVTNVILNLIYCTFGGIGFGTNSLRGEILEAICSKLSLIEKTKDIEKISKVYLEDSNQLNQIELYALNRKIVKAAVEVIIKYDIVSPYFNLLGQYVMNSLMIKNNDKNLSIVLEDLPGIKEVIQEGDTDNIIKYTVTSREISFVFQGTSFNISKNSENYNAIYQAVIDNDHSSLDDLVTSQQKLKENIKAVVSTLNIDADNCDNIEIKIVDKTILCNNKIFKGLASMEFIKYVAENNIRMISQFKRFMFNCSLNPSNASVEELYDFVVKNRLKVTPAGTILLYKWVGNNYHDCRTGNFNNSPGLTIKMDRNKVNPNRHETCSNGLHLCSYKYGKFGDRLLLVELDPKNSVSIPTDYSQSKMRCCEYTSLMDITEFVSVMDKEGDFLSRVENVHYNTKILETELMKMYPDVVRKNSINGLNNLTGKDQDKISEIVLNFEIPEIQVVDVTNNEEFFEGECLVENGTVEVAGETADKIETKDECIEFPRPEILQNEKIEVETKPENPVISESIPALSIIENLELFLNCKEYDQSIIVEENYKEITDKLKVIDEVIYGYALQKIGKKSYETKAAELLDLMTVFRYIKHDEISITEVSDDAKSNANQIKLKDGISNPDKVSVYETPKESSVLGKISKIFKKLW